MPNLYEKLAELTTEWRTAGYPSADFPAIAEMLEWAGASEEGEVPYLRRPQIRALETYWYLRLVEETPHVFDLYRRAFPPETDKQRLLEALGVPDAAFRDANFELDQLWDRLQNDEAFARTHRLDALRETLTLDYPSYILALAMGAGKTVLPRHGGLRDDRRFQRRLRVRYRALRRPGAQAGPRKGTYELPGPKGKTTVAVKIVDMLGEEILITEQV